MDHKKVITPFRQFARLAVVLAMLAVLFLSSASTARSAAGINRYVSPGGFNSSNCSDPLTPCKTITYALGQAASGDTILMDLGTYHENLTITKNIRIVHNPASSCPTTIPCSTIDGSSAGRVMDISGYYQVSLEKIAIQNGKVTNDSGAGIRNTGDLTLDGVTVQNNTIIGSSYTYRGGGIDNQGTLTVRNSYIHDNSAYDGGGIASTGSLTVISTEIYANSAQRYGGGIDDPYCSALKIQNSTLWDNHAIESGGGVFTYDGGMPAACVTSLFNNVTFSGNSSTNGIGGLWTLNRVVIDHGTFANNSTASGTVEEIYLGEHQIGTSNPDPLPSILRSTIISHPSASLDLCQFSTADPASLSGGHNLSSDNSCGFTTPTDQHNVDPLLLTLADNGGPVQTMALSFGSPAIDHGGVFPDSLDPLNPYLSGRDARGMYPYDGNLDGIVTPDIGAFEYVPQQVYIPIVTK